MTNVNYNPDGSHPPSLKERDNIVNTWANTPFPFSLEDGWGRYGILGVLGQLILQGLPNTHILEIGTGESSIYFTEIARRLNRQIFYCDITYGKIYNPFTAKGYLHEDTLIIKYPQEDISNIDFNKHKAYGCVMSSDDFFKQVKFPNIGVAFIDGDHCYTQAKKDFDNAFELLVDDGIIFLHDTYPDDEDKVLNDYCADVYKLRQELEKRNDIDCFTFTKTVAVDVGLTMIRKKPKNRKYYHE